MTTLTKMHRDFPRRKPNRLKDFDYSSGGYYFVTILTENRVNYFGEVINGVMQFNDIGKVANDFWLQIPDHYAGVELDGFIIMPNHIHGIIIINESGMPWKKSAIAPRRYKTLSKIIAYFKASATKEIRSSIGIKEFGWQRSFYDHVIRNEKALFKIREYINQNPLKWHLDDYHCE